MTTLEELYDILYSYDISCPKTLYSTIDQRLFDECESIADMLCADFTIEYILLEKGEGISESASGTFCDDAESFIFSTDSLGLTYVFESMEDIFESDFSEVEAEGS